MNTTTTNQIEKCPHCGANMNKYWHSLTLGLATVLKRFAYAASLNENIVHVPYDIALTKAEYNNFQKLRYFGLVAKHKEGGQNLSGRWLLTTRGRQFLMGEKGVPDRVQTFRNRITDWSENYITYEQVSKHPYFEDLGHFLETSEIAMKKDIQSSLIGGRI